MKIRNEKTGSEYSSDTLKRFDASECYNSYFFDENNQLTFCVYDGWEEAKEEHLPCTVISLISYLNDNRAKGKRRVVYREWLKIDKAWWTHDWRTIINYISEYCYENKK